VPGVVRGALRARRAQAATVLVLTGLAVAVAAAAPWYVTAAAQSVAVADVAGAPAHQRVVRVTGRVEGGAAPGVGERSGAQAVADAEEQASAVLRVPDAAATVSLRESGAISSALARVSLRLVYRDGMCEHLDVGGACPAGPDEVLLSRRTAQALQVTAGDTVDFVLPSQPARAVRVVGTYQIRDPLGPYWAGVDLGSGANLDPGAAGTGDPAFVTSDMVAALPLREIVAEYHLVIPERRFLDDPAGLRADLARQVAGSRGWRVETAAPALAERIERERALVALGVGVAAVQLLALCWFGLFFAVRHTAEQRRPDVGLLKLRGAAGWRQWHLVIAQSAVPMALGAVAGAAAGLGLVRLLAGDAGGAAQARSAALLSAAAALAALAGAVAAAVAADARAMRTPVTDLLRHVPSRRRGWRAEVVDLLIVLVAAAGLYQSYATAREPDTTDGLALLAPALVAVLVALVAARSLTPLAGRLARAALRAGRVPVALGATQLARRPGTHRVFALLVVAVALLTTAAGGWHAAAQSRDDRGRHQLGADRVLTVQARGRAQLLAAVRAADPGGRHAMAVVRGSDGPSTAVLAVDSARFASVVDWHPRYAGLSPDAVAALLHPPAPAPLSTPDGELTLDAAGGAGPPTSVVATLTTAAGEPVTLRFGPVGPARARYTAPLSGCGAAGCRLVGFELVTRGASGRLELARPGAAVTLYGLSPVAPGTVLGDVTRWRGSLSPTAVGPALAAEGGALTITALDAGRASNRSTRVYAVDAPTPLPVVTTAQLEPPAAGDARLPVFGGDPVPVRFAGAVGTMPVAPRFGYLVDLEYAERVAEDTGLGDVPQVWLRADAPPDILDRLRAAGLTVISDETARATIDRLGREAPPAALRFQLVAGLVGLLLAAGAFVVVAAVERPERAGELAALRAQGLAPRAVRAVAWGGYGSLALSAVLLGVAASALAQSVTRRPVPLFLDGWNLLPAAVGPQPLPILAGLLAGLVVVGAAAATAALLLVRAVREVAR